MKQASCCVDEVLRLNRVKHGEFRHKVDVREKRSEREDRLIVTWFGHVEYMGEWHVTITV